MVILFIFLTLLKLSKTQQVIDVYIIVYLSIFYIMYLFYVVSTIYTRVYESCSKVHG